MGMTFRPANSASPWSKTELMTWLWRALPNNFIANKERRAGGLHIGGGSHWRVSGKLGRNVLHYILDCQPHSHYVLLWGICQAPFDGEVLIGSVPTFYPARMRD